MWKQGKNYQGLASREVEEAEGLAIKQPKWESHELVCYLCKGDMMNMREGVAYGEKFTEAENAWVSSERQKPLKLMHWEWQLERSVFQPLRSWANEAASPEEKVLNKSIRLPVVPQD